MDYESILLWLHPYNLWDWQTSIHFAINDGRTASKEPLSSWIRLEINANSIVQTKLTYIQRMIIMTIPLSFLQFGWKVMYFVQNQICLIVVDGVKMGEGQNALYSTAAWILIPFVKWWSASKHVHSKQHQLHDVLICSQILCRINDRWEKDPSVSQVYTLCPNLCLSNSKISPKFRILTTIQQAAKRSDMALKPIICKLQINLIERCLTRTRTIRQHNKLQNTYLWISIIQLKEWRPTIGLRTVLRSAYATVFAKWEELKDLCPAQRELEFNRRLQSFEAKHDPLTKIIYTQLFAGEKLAALKDIVLSSNSKQERGEQVMKLEGPHSNQSQLSIEAKEEVEQNLQVSKHTPPQVDSAQSSRTDQELIQNTMDMPPKKQGQNPEIKQSSSFASPLSQESQVSALCKERMEAIRMDGSKRENNQVLEQAISLEEEEKNPPVSAKIGTAKKKQEQPNQEEQAANMGQLLNDGQKSKKEVIVTGFNVILSDSNSGQVDEEVLEKQAETSKDTLALGDGREATTRIWRESLELLQSEGKKEVTVMVSAGSGASDQLAGKGEDEGAEGEEKAKEEKGGAFNRN